jgi:hypothetical protein
MVRGMRAWRLLLLSLWIAAVPARADEAGDVRVFLRRSFPGKSWDAGPDRIDSPEIHAAYPGLTFYVVASREPWPPATRSHAAHETFRREMARIHRTKVTAVIGLDAHGQLFVRDYLNRGLRPVHTAADARKSCIALLSLAQAEVSPPALLDSPEVEVTPDSQGWHCKLTVRDRLQGEVRFDGRGRCIRAEKWYLGPLPPVQPPVAPGGLSP